MITCIIIFYYHVVCTSFLHNDVIVLNLINFVDDCV